VGLVPGVMGKVLPFPPPLKPGEPGYKEWLLQMLKAALDRKKRKG